MKATDKKNREGNTLETLPAAIDPQMRFYAFGETAIVLEYTKNTELRQDQTLQGQQRLIKLKNSLISGPSPRGIVDCVPGNQNLTVVFDPLQTTAQNICQQINTNWTDSGAPMERSNTDNTEVITLAVSYGGEFGPDLEAVADHHNTSIENVIEQHSSVTYTVLFNGFLPGFPYLHGLPQSLHTPRRKSPRTKVIAGSIAIGGSQTGIYPMDSPGGWQIIGRCQLDDQRLFDPERSPPQLFPAGTRIRFDAT